MNGGPNQPADASYGAVPAAPGLTKPCPTAKDPAKRCDNFNLLGGAFTQARCVGGGCLGRVWAGHDGVGGPPPCPHSRPAGPPAPSCVRSLLTAAASTRTSPQHPQEPAVAGLPANPVVWQDFSIGAFVRMAFHDCGTVIR